MLNKYHCLEELARHRKDEVIITTMGTSKPWEALSDTGLDFASVDGAMGHAADLALGVAIAQPERRVIALNGDGSMLMCLGTLVTIAQRPCENLALVIVENGTYEVTGNQNVPGASFIDYAAIAKGCGIDKVHTIDTEEDFDAKLPLLLSEPGPVVFIWKIEPGNEPVPKIKDTLAARAERFRLALAE